MSMTMAITSPPKEKHHRKHKDKSEKKSSKKRHREEQAIEEQQLRERQSSPTKKRRKDPEPLHGPLSSQSVGLKASQTSAEKDSSPFFQQTASLYLPLAPISQKDAIPGLCAEHLSPLVLTYYPPLKGIILSYSNVRLVQSPTDPTPPSDRPVYAHVVDEYAATLVWVMADFLVLRPRKDMWIEGSVNLQNESHLGLVCWNLFSASIERKRLPQDWTWIDSESAEAGYTDGETELALAEGEGHFVDGNKKVIEGSIKFRVRDFESSPWTENDRGFFSIEGTLLSEKEEKDLEEQERSRAEARSGKQAKRSHASRSDVPPS